MWRRAAARGAKAAPSATVTVFAGWFILGLIFRPAMPGAPDPVHFVSPVERITRKIGDGLLPKSARHVARAAGQIFVVKSIGWTDE